MFAKKKKQNESPKPFFSCKLKIDEIYYDRKKNITLEQERYSIDFQSIIPRRLPSLLPVHLGQKRVQSQPHARVV